ncbi:hypothetical protein EAF04_001386 [Stromatinia cepivora]|nr:hypothetical protein EAF04_001386 [Stromatinia cepivora]
MLIRNKPDAQRPKILVVLPELSTFVGYPSIKDSYLYQCLTGPIFHFLPFPTVPVRICHYVTMRGGDRNRRTLRHHDEAHYRHDNRNGSQYPPAGTHHQNTRLGHRRLQDSRYCIQKPENQNQLAPHRSYQASKSNRPNHHFLIRSKHLKEYLLTSLRSHIERIEEWLPDSECGGSDGSDGGSDNIKRDE